MRYVQDKKFVEQNTNRQLIQTKKRVTFKKRTTNTLYCLMPTMLSLLEEEIMIDSTFIWLSRV